MADLGELSARITAQIQEFERGMDNATGKLDNFGKTSQRAGGQAGKGMAVAGKAIGVAAGAAVAAAAAFAAAGAAIVALGARGMKASDEQAKLARQLGITNAELATLQRASEFAGMSSSALTTNMQRLNRSMGETLQGTGQAGQAFERLGLSVQDLQGMRADEQMQAIASAMGTLGTRAEQAAVAQQIFGRGGQEMLVFLDDAEGNLGRARTQVDAFGLALSEVETDRIESANDALSSIGAVIQGLANRIAARVAPLIEFLALKFEDVAIETRGFESVVDGVFTFIIRAAGFVANAIEGIRRAFAVVQHAARVMGNIITQVFAWNIRTISGFVDGAIDMINKVIEAANKVASIIGAEIQTIGRTAESAFVQSVQSMADESARAAQESRDNLSTILGAPWPGEALEDFLRQLGELDETTAAMSRRTTMPELGDGEGELGVATAGVDYEKELQTLREFVMTEEEIERSRHQQRVDLLREANEQIEGGVVDFHQLMEDLEHQHMDRLGKIRQDGLDAIGQFQAMAWHQQTSQVMGELSSLTTGLDRENRAQFAIMKAGAVAQAAVNTYLGITRSLSSYPMPLAGIMAAAHAAAGFAQVSNIRSQQFGSGASGSASTPTPSPSEAQGQESRSLLVQGDFDSGQLFTGDAVRSLMDRIAEAQKDGYTVVMA